MRDAAVGFQCPSCVKEGSRTTRQARNRFGAISPGQPALVTKTLIGINAAVWLLILATGAASSAWVDRLELIPRGYCLALAHPGNVYRDVHTGALCSTFPDGSFVPGVADGHWLQLFTSMFTHVEIWHIGFNMLALWFLGPQLEQALGRLRFTGLYLLSGLVGSAFVYWFAPPESGSLGASGAIFGLLGALLVIAIKVKADLQQLLMWIGLNVAITVFGAGAISWQAHLGGFVGGAALAAVLAYAPRRSRTTWQAAGFGAVAVLVVAAVVIRTSILG